MVQVTFAALFVALLAAATSSAVQAHPRFVERATFSDCTTAITGTLGYGSISSKGLIRMARSNAALSTTPSLTSSFSNNPARNLVTQDDSGNEVAASSFEWANCTAALQASGWSLQMPASFNSLFGPSTGKTFEYGWGILRPEGASVHCMALQSAPIDGAFSNVPLLSTPCASTTHASRIFFAARQINNDTAATFMAPVPLVRAGSTVLGHAVTGPTGSVVLSSSQISNPRFLTLLPESDGC